MFEIFLHSTRVDCEIVLMARVVKDYDVDIRYHQIRANVVADVLS